MRRLKLILLMILTGVMLSKPIAAQSNKSFQWIGGPTYVLRLGTFKILTDPMFGPKSDKAFILEKHPTSGALNAKIERFTEPAVVDSSGIDVLLISHLHADHFDDRAKQLLDKDLMIIALPTNSKTLLQWGFGNIKSLDWNNTRLIVKGKEMLRIDAVKAIHARDEPLNTELGKVNGYVIEYYQESYDEKSVFRIYWTGDTVWFDEMKKLKQLGKIDLLIPNMGAVGADGEIGRRGLNADEALKLIENLNPSLTIPVHHSTFSHYVEPISVFRNLVEKTKYKNRIKILKENSTVDF